MQPVWVLICNPENRRQALFTEALYKQQGTLPVIVSYRKLLSTSAPSEYLIDRLKPIKFSQIYIKIESPGENFEVSRALIAIGSREHNSRLNPILAKGIVYDKGRFQYLKEWYLGYRCLLEEISTAVNCLREINKSNYHYLNSPSAILQMLDKYHCQCFLSSKGVVVPKLIPISEDFTEFLEHLKNTRQYSVFVKPKYGSSAAGVIALRIKPDGSECIARTSLELLRIAGQTRCYNSLKVRTYKKKKQIAELYVTIFKEGAYAEQWLPKPQLKGLNFDLRVVVTYGKAAHCIARCSKTPMTNLHLGNQRGNLLQHKDAEIILENAYHCAEKAASIFSVAGCIGADVVLPSSRFQAHIVELNAFGDLLPNTYHKGRTTYESQICMS